MDREEIRRRLKAARAFAGFSKPAALAEAAPCKENGLRPSGIIRIESMVRDAKPWELECIAKACGLPVSWFTAPFERLDEATSTDERLDEIAETLRELNGSA
jgi:hypothetical protein